MNNSFLGKAFIVIGLIVAATVVVFFAINKKDIEEKSEEVEVITSLNVDTYDVDLYLYNLSDNIISGSKYFYNQIYLENNDIVFDQYTINTNTKIFLKNLSNTEKDVNNIRITYDPISFEQFKYLYENYDMLKVSIWLKDNQIDKMLLYSNNNIYLEVGRY